MESQMQSSQQQKAGSKSKHHRMEKAESHEIRALLLKNISLQSKQPFTNCCQIVTPIICLIFTMLIRNIALANLTTQGDSLYSEFPLIPIKMNDFTFADDLDQYVERDPLEWFQYEYGPLVNTTFLGENDGRGYKSGMLGKVIPISYYWMPMNSSMQPPFYSDWTMSPCFRKPPRGSTIDEDIFNRFEFLNNENHSTISGTRTKDHMPSGAVYFYEASNNSLKANVRVNDLRQLDYHRTDGLTKIKLRTNINDTFSSYYMIQEGFLTMIDFLDSSYMKQSTGKTLVSGYLYMPAQQNESAFIDMLVNTVATILFPLSLSLLLPVFLYLIVLQKQEKLIQMMRMNGMGMASYWFVNFLFNFLISLLMNIVFCGAGYLMLDSAFFKQTSWGVIFVVLLGWMLSQIGMAMFFQAFLSNSRAANIIGYLIAIWTNLIGATLSIALFQYPVELPVGFSLWPTFSFNRLFYLMFTNCSNDHCFNSFAVLTDEMWRCIAVLYLSFPIFSLAGMYLYEVIPQEYGVAKSVFFPIHFIFGRCCGEENVVQIQQQENDKDLSDKTIEEERHRIHSIRENTKHFPLICSGLTKVYPNGKRAVNELNLLVEDNKIFGLLGPNGAGKTTLLSMITGIFSATQGQGFIGGYSIRSQIDKVHLEMGVCPQFDILWPILNVEEHLYFYARLKGVPRKSEDSRVNQALQEVNLTKERKYKIHQLSGGMKRRLSVGISLVGNPRIVFMDEPTTGLDPENRRHLWEVLSKCKEKRSVFLTTHLMEQAETLCDRIGIITNGNLRTVGDQFLLKEIYGKGYFVSINVEMEKDRLWTDNKVILNDEQDQNKSEYSQSNFSVNDSLSPDESPQISKKNQHKLAKMKQKLLQMFEESQVVKEINGLIKINIGSMEVSQILQRLNQIEDDSIKFEWSINNSTLQDVFLEVICKFDKQQIEGVPKDSLLTQNNEQQ